MSGKNLNTKSRLFLEKLESKPRFIIRYGLQIGLIPLVFFFYLASQLSTNPISIEPHLVDTLEIKNEFNTLTIRLINDSDASAFENYIAQPFELEFSKSKTVLIAKLREISPGVLNFQLVTNDANHLVLKGSEKPSIKNKKTFLESILEIFY